MRQAFIKALTEEARINPKICLITADLGYKILDSFKDEFPDRFINIGVAEANMMSVAAGMSSVGFAPFVYSIATFASMRPYEQIRNDVCLQNMNVKIVAIGGGMAYDKAGPTHHSMEDIAIIRSLSNIKILNPSTTDICFQATKYLARSEGPAYMRIERNPDEPFYPYQKSDFKVGEGQIIKKGSKIAILSTGTKISFSLEIARLLFRNKIDAAVFSFPTIEPIDRELLASIANEYALIATIEEHRTNGGFGTAVLENISVLKGNSSRILRFGLKNKFPEISGDYETLMEDNGLTPEQIAKSILRYEN